jgi:hypothetical protein
VKPVAKRLIDRFGSLAGVLGAAREELEAVKGVGEASIVALKIVREAALGAAHRVTEQLRQCSAAGQRRDLLGAVKLPLRLLHGEDQRPALRIGKADVMAVELEPALLIRRLLAKDREPLPKDAEPLPKNR